MVLYVSFLTVIKFKMELCMRLHENDDDDNILITLIYGMIISDGSRNGLLCQSK